MSWRAFNPVAGGVSSIGELLPAWHILETETVTTAPRREYALHGEFILDGTLNLEEDSRLIIEA